MIQKQVSAKTVQEYMCTYVYMAMERKAVSEAKGAAFMIV